MRKSRRSRIASINVIPYLDVMLVLLVIFMATAPLFNPGVVDVPEVDSGTPDISRGEIGLRVEYRLNKSVTVFDEYGEPVTFVDIDAAMNHIETECLLKPERPVAVAGEAEQFHEEVMVLRSRIRIAGCQKIGFYVSPTQ